MDKKLGVTQDYDRSNYDSASAKRTYKEKAFGDSAVITDPTTGEILHKSQTAAQNKYHMKMMMVKIFLRSGQIIQQK